MTNPNAKSASSSKSLFAKLRSWEAFLTFALILIILVNSTLIPQYFTIANQINLFQLSIEKVIVALVMTFVIINAEIDLSVGSIMGLAACLFGWLFQNGVSGEMAIFIVMIAGGLAGALNGYFIAIVGLPSLVVTLATLIGFRGLARVLVEDRGITDFPDWFDALGQQGLIGPIPFSFFAFIVLFIIAFIILHRSAFGRLTYTIGNNCEVAEFAGVNTAAVKMKIFIASGLVAAFAGLLYAARVGAVRGDVALGFELDIITLVLLGGVSIFGGSGTMVGTLLALLIVLNLRNGMALMNVTGHIQTGVIGVLLIVSVVLPRLDITRIFKSRSPQGTKQ